MTPCSVHSTVCCAFPPALKSPVTSRRGLRVVVHCRFRGVLHLSPADPCPRPARLAPSLFFPPLLPTRVSTSSLTSRSRADSNAHTPDGQHRTKQIARTPSCLPFSSLVCHWGSHRTSRWTRVSQRTAALRSAHPCAPAFGFFLSSVLVAAISCFNQSSPDGHLSAPLHALCWPGGLLAPPHVFSSVCDGTRIVAPASSPRFRSIYMC